MSSGQAENQPGQRKRGSRALFLSFVSVLVGLGCFLAAWAVEYGLVRAEFYPLVLLQGAVYDRGMTLAARQARDTKRTGPVVVVAVDETTRERLASVPSFLPGLPGKLRFRDDERAFHVRVLENLRRLGAAVVGFDVVFDEPEDRLDPYLARAMRDHGQVILAALDEQGVLRSGVERTHSLQYPIPALRDASAGMGITNIPLDADRTARRFSWWFTGIDDDANDVLIPSLGAAAAALYGGSDPRTVIAEKVKPHRLFLGNEIEWLPDRDSPTSFIRYYGDAGTPAGPTSRIPYEDVFHAFDPQKGAPGRKVEADWLKEQISGKVVLIGDATVINQDYHRVPVLSRRRFEPDTNQMAGVEIQAHVVQTALEGRWIHRAPYGIQVLLLLLTCLLAAILGRWLDPRPFLVCGVLLFGGLYAGSISLLAGPGYWIEPVTPSFGLGVTLLAESVFMFFAERKQRTRLRRELGRQVGSRVAEALSEEDWPEVGGESREVTMLFSDLKGFTSLSENLTPPEICEMLNRYFGVMFPILFRYEGTVDKLMGDGMMAYFGWPERRPDHAERAVKCAIEMQQALREWQQLAENADLPPLLTRIGIHTGVATIGNVGFGERREFTVIGDIVNVASRLEGMNKEFGTTLLISEATRDAAGEIAPMTFRGAATVRGRKEPMPVYSVESEGIDG